MVEVTDSSLYLAYVGSDFYEEGRQAALWLEEEQKRNKIEKKTLNLVILKGTEGSSSEIGRSNGFQSIANLHTEWRVIAQEDGEYTTTKAKEIMSKILRERKDIDVIVSQNDDMTFGVLEALEEAGLEAGRDKDVQIISFDAVDSALKLVKKGIISVDVECNPRQAP